MNFLAEFSPAKFPYLPEKTAYMPNIGHFTVTFVFLNRLMDVFKI